MTAQPDGRRPTDPEPAPTTFDDVWSRVDEIPGWLTPAQGRALWDRASSVPAAGRIVEIGSYRGRSACVLATAAGPAGARTTAIDPFISGLGIRERDKVSQELFEANLEKLGVRDAVDLIVARSGDARPGWSGVIDFLYIDGKHDMITVLDDLKWAEHVRDGGDVAIHDSFSSVGVTLGLLVGALPARSLRYRGRAGSLALFTKEKPNLGSRLAMLAQLPWFARNVFIKVLLRLRLRPVARLLGHDSPADPY